MDVHNQPSLVPTLGGFGRYCREVSCKIDITVFGEIILIGKSKESLE
jgi:hypothetical protein